MDWQIAKFTLDVLALLLSVSAWIYAWRVSRRQAQRAEIDALKAAIDAERDRRRHDTEQLANRLTRTETRLNSAPTGEALHEVALSISGLAGDIKVAFSRLDGLGEVVKRLEVIANRQEEFLLNMRDR